MFDTPEDLFERFWENLENSEQHENIRQGIQLLTYLPKNFSMHRYAVRQSVAAICRHAKVQIDPLVNYDRFERPSKEQLKELRVLNDDFDWDQVRDRVYRLAEQVGLIQ